MLDINMYLQIQTFFLYSIATRLPLCMQKTLHWVSKSIAMPNSLSSMVQVQAIYCTLKLHYCILMKIVALNIAFHRWEAIQVNMFPTFYKNETKLPPLLHWASRVDLNDNRTSSWETKPDNASTWTWHATISRCW